MADKNLPVENLPVVHVAQPSDEALAARRAFLRRAALAGLPVLIATVPGRTVWARQEAGTLAATCGGSLVGSCTSATQPVLG